MEHFSDTQTSYTLAKTHWEWVMRDAAHVDQFDPRDPHGAIEDTLVRAHGCHQAEARFVSRIALDSVLETIDTL